jgi:hypothetical protein
MILISKMKTRLLVLVGLVLAASCKLNESLRECNIPKGERKAAKAKIIAAIDSVFEAQRLGKDSLWCKKGYDRVTAYECVDSLSSLKARNERLRLTVKNNCGYWEVIDFNKDLKVEQVGHLFPEIY